MSKSAAKESRFSSPVEGNREIMRIFSNETSPARAFAADLDIARMILGNPRQLPLQQDSIKETTHRKCPSLSNLGHERVGESGRPGLGNDEVLLSAADAPGAVH